MEFDPKDPREIEAFEFDFAQRLAADETIISAAVTCRVISGEHPDADLMVFGYPTISGSKVIQKIAGGELGVAYHLECEIQTSTEQILISGGDLSIKLGG